MLNAFRPSPGWNSARGCPDLHLAWRGCRVEPAAVDLMRATAELGAVDSSGKLDICYAQVTGFRLVMALLTHPAWPLPIWNALQVRNRLRLHAPLVPGDTFDLEARMSGWRVLAKGVEIDVHSRLLQQDTCGWESIVSFYYRGRHGVESSGGQALGAGATSPIVPDSGTESTSWNVGDGHRWRYAGLTGDYNGLHQWDWYARRMGFPAAFPHPQRILGQCLARLPSAGPAPLELDLWIKGPVFFGRQVTMRHHSRPESGCRGFGLWLDGESRPALLGTLGPLR
jgi:acyl dehydratase